MEMLEHYRSLRKLIDRQSELLASGRQEGLDQITHQIRTLNLKIEGFTSYLGALSEPERSLLTSEITQVQLAVERSLEGWRRFLGTLQSEGQQIMATKRYFAALQTREEAGRRYSVKG